MEKENSTEEEAVGFPAPKNVTEVDNKSNVPTKNDLSDDKIVGTTIHTSEKPVEEASYVHEEGQDVKPLTTPANHLLDHELDGEKIPSSKRHLVDAEREDTSDDMEIKSREDDEFSDNRTPSSSAVLSKSENSVNNHAAEPDIQKVDQENSNSTKDTTLSSANAIEISGREDDNSNDNSSPSSIQPSSSGKSISIVTGESYTQKEDQEKGNSTKDTALSCASAIEISGREDDNTNDNSSPSSKQLSNSGKLISVVTNESETQKEDQEKGNSIKDTALTSENAIEISNRDDDNSTDNSSSSSMQPLNSGNSITILTGELDTPKENTKGNFVDDTTPCVATNIEIRAQEEDNFANKSSSSSPARLSTSENLISALPVGNSVNDTITSDCVKGKNDTGQFPETTIANHQCAENIEMKTMDVSHETFSKQDGESSSVVETGDIESNSIDNTSGKKEQSLVLYGTGEPKVEAKATASPGKASVLTKFVKLCAASNIFRTLPRGNDFPNDLKDNNSNNNDSSKGKSQEVSHTTREKPRWSLLNLSLVRTSQEKNQGNKADLQEVFLESTERKTIKGRILLYTKLWCKNCKEARIFLRKRRLRYIEINIDVYPSRKEELEEITGSSDVPKVFFNQVLIGGLNDLKDLDESGQLEEKIEYVTKEGPSPKAPLPPYSGEDDVSSRVGVDELAVIVRNMKGSIVVKDHFHKFRRVTNCFLGSEAVDFLSEDQFLEREGAIEFARKLAKELFFRHVFEENTFEDGNHLYRFLDHDPVISQCQNIPRGIIQLKRQPLVELSRRLRFLLYAILDAYTSEDGKHIAYRTIHGSEEFARYLRIAEELHRVDLNKIAKEETLAFFINLYNLMTIHAILVRGHPEGALDRRKLFNDFKYVIGGCAYSLSDIYNGILRANKRPPYALAKPFGISDKRFKVALTYPEPLIHFALVSGNQSAPALRCYSPENIDKELMEASRDFLQGGGFVLNLDSMTISVTKILKWYSVDFGKNDLEILKHVANYLEVEKTQNILELLDSTSLKVVYQPYDWRLNS